MTSTTTTRMRSVAVTIVAFAALALMLRIVDAGSLSPVAPPASTMASIEEIYSALVGTSYDSHLIPAMKNGDVMNEVKCIIGKMKGFGECAYTYAKAPTPICVNGLVASLLPDDGEASVTWDDFSASDITDVPVSRYFFIATATRAYGYDDQISGVYDCADEAASPVITDVYACNGFACDFCQTFIDVQDYTGVCAAPPSSGPYPFLLGLSGSTVEIDISDTATVPWASAILRTSGAISEYGVSKGGPFITDSEPVDITFTCSELGSNTVTWRACNGTFCNAIDTAVFVMDNFANCP